MGRSYALWMLCLCVAHTSSQVNRAACPQVAGYAFLPHEYPCYFYTCYRGALLSPSVYKCPSEPKYYNLLEASGVSNPCSTCPQSPVKTPETVPTTQASTTTVSPPSSGTSTVQTPDPPSSSTVTAPTTPPPDTSPGLTLKEITLVVSNAHVHGAVWVGDGTSLRQCLVLCEDMPECSGFDFDIGSASCWIHKGPSVCGPTERKENCTHFRVFDQCPPTTDTTQPSFPGNGVTTQPSSTGNGVTTQPSSPGNGVTSTAAVVTTSQPFLTTFIGWNIRGGTLIPMATGTATPDICIAICRMDTECYGVDYDGRTKSCWVHGQDTECNEMVEKPDCSHFRFDITCDESEESTTQPGLSSTQDPDQSTGPGTDGPTPELQAVPAGYFELAEGYHVPGGRLIFSGVSVRQCLDACLTSPYCLAIDYDTVDGSCYFHSKDSYCGQAFELRGNYHLKRLPCIPGVVNDAITTWYHFHVELGEEFCTGCTLGSCMEACYTDPACAGIDFDIRNLGCYFFQPAGVCGPLTPKDYCIHLSRNACVPDSLNALPIDSLVLLAYPPPSAVPSGWQVYPGVRVRHGVQAGTYGLEADACLAHCERDPDCQSGDYDMADGSCWLHLGNRQCAQFEASDSVWHFKKHGCDAVFGTLQPFVSPVWVAP